MKWIEESQEYSTIKSLCGDLLLNGSVFPSKVLRMTPACTIFMQNYLTDGMFFTSLARFMRIIKESVFFVFRNDADDASFINAYDVYPAVEFDVSDGPSLYETTLVHRESEPNLYKSSDCIVAFSHTLRWVAYGDHGSGIAFVATYSTAAVRPMQLSFDRRYIYTLEDVEHTLTSWAGCSFDRASFVEAYNPWIVKRHTDYTL